MPSPYSFDLLADFAIANPDVSLTFDFAAPEAALQKVLENEIDIAIGCFAETSLSSEFKKYVIGNLDYVVAVSPSHPLAKQDFVFRKDLENYRELSLSGKTIPSSMLELPSGSQKWYSNSYCLLFHVAIHGAGWISVPYLLIKDEVEAGRLKILNIYDIKLKKIAPYYMVTRNKFVMTKPALWLKEELYKKMNCCVRHCNI